MLASCQHTKNKENHSENCWLPWEPRLSQHRPPQGAPALQAAPRCLHTACSARRLATQKASPAALSNICRRKLPQSHPQKDLIQRSECSTSLKSPRSVQYSAGQGANPLVEQKGHLQLAHPSQNSPAVVPPYYRSGGWSTLTLCLACDVHQRHSFLFKSQAKIHIPTSSGSLCFLAYRKMQWRGPSHHTLHKQRNSCSGPVLETAVVLQ